MRVNYLLNNRLQPHDLCKQVHTMTCLHAGRVYSDKCNVTVWRPSVCLSVSLSACLSRLFLTLIERATHTQRDSPGGSMHRGHRKFRTDNTEDRYACIVSNAAATHYRDSWRNRIVFDNIVINRGISVFSEFFETAPLFVRGALAAAAERLQIEPRAKCGRAMLTVIEHVLLPVSFIAADRFRISRESASQHERTPSY